MTVPATRDNRNIVTKSFSFASPTGVSGSFYTAGFYESSASDANLTEASTTQTIGGANAPYEAHAFVVMGAAGSVTGGGVVEIEVSGTSYQDDGTRTTTDTEVLVVNIENASTDEYFETSKKWLGQVTFTIQAASGTPSAFSADFNYGLVKYDDFGNRNFTLKYFEAVGLAGANDSGFDIEVIKHSPTGHTYHATAFVPGAATLVQMSTLHGTENDLDSNEHFSLKKTGLSEFINGDDSEGLVIRITTGANAAVRSCDMHAGVVLI